jgi:hypothetical protein
VGGFGQCYRTKGIGKNAYGEVTMGRAVGLWEVLSLKVYEVRMKWKSWVFMVKKHLVSIITDLRRHIGKFIKPQRAPEETSYFKMHIVHDSKSRYSLLL